MGATSELHKPLETWYAGNNFYIRPTFVVSVPEFVSNKPKSGRCHSNSRKNLTNNKANGNVSAKAQSKIKNAVNWLLQAAKSKRVYDKKSGKHFMFRVNFVTLTIPYHADMPSDNVIKSQLLHPWIVYCSKYFGLRNYVWRAETQANGMIHFHLLTDSFIHWRKIRGAWNKRLDSLGLLDAFEKEHGHKSPNSTDVHAVKGIQNLGAYIAKYVAKKDDKRRPISGRIWSCSYSLSHENKTTARCDPDETKIQVYQLERAAIPCKDILSAPDSMGQVRRIAELYSFTAQCWSKIRNSPIGKAYFDRIFAIRTNTIQMPLEYYTINEETCQLTTQSTPKTGSPKYVHQFSNELVTAAKNAAAKIAREAIEIARRSLLSATNSNWTGQDATDYVF